MPHAIRFHRTGGPEVLAYDEVLLPEMGPGEVHVRRTAVGVNFIDTIQADVRQTFPLRDAAEAQRALESRATTGATVLLP